MTDLWRKSLPSVHWAVERKLGEISLLFLKLSTLGESDEQSNNKGTFVKRESDKEAPAQPYRLTPDKFARLPLPQARWVSEILWDDRPPSECVLTVAQHGTLEVLKLFASASEVTPDILLVTAAEGGNFDSFVWVLTRSKYFVTMPSRTHIAFAVAVKEGHSNICSVICDFWAKHNIDPDHDIIRMAASVAARESNFGALEQCLRIAPNAIYTMLSRMSSRFPYSAIKWLEQWKQRQNEPDQYDYYVDE